MGNHTLRDLFEITRIPSIPAVADKIKSFVGEPELDLTALSKLIRNDIGLVCAFVRKANAKLNSMREVSSVHQAVQVCGQTDSREILEQVESLDQLPNLFQFKEMFEFAWSNCISQGLAAESLKEFGLIDDDSTTFLTGILSDMGAVALMQTYPEEYHEKVWKELEGGKELTDLCQLEHSAFKFSHITVGHELGRRWRLGEAFSSSILQHHQEINGGFYSMTSQAANKAVELLEFKTDQTTKRAELDEHLKICFQLTSEEVDQMLNNIEQRRQNIFQDLNLPCTSTIS